MNINNNESWKCHDCRHYMDDDYEDDEVCCVDNNEYIGRDKLPCEKFEKPLYRYGIPVH